MPTPRLPFFSCWLSPPLEARTSIRAGQRWLAAAAVLSLPVAAAATGLPALDHVQEKMAGLAVPFEANQGQFAPDVAFAARTFAGNIFVTRDGRLVHALAGRPQPPNAEQRKEAFAPRSGRNDRILKSQPPRGSGWALIESLEGAAHLAPSGTQPSATRVSRFAGTATPNQTSRIATFDRVRLGEAWPGVSVELAARGSNVEKLFTVASYADPEAIRIHIAGAEKLRLGDDGSLIATTGNGDIAFTPPVALQDIGGLRIEVPVRYVLLAHDGYRFAITGAYDHGQPLVIDPLLQATYLGGSGDEQAYALAIDAGGNVLVAGTTFSTNFPGTHGGAQSASSAGSTDAFVARLSSSLTTLIQATYLGGYGSNGAYALALDAAGNVLVAGDTVSTNFPGTAGGAQSASGGNGFHDAFVARLSGDLTTLVQSTYLGGGHSDSAYALALDPVGNVLVAGVTGSTNFPGTTGGAQPTSHGLDEAFVARLSSDLKTLVQATYLGGGSSDQANALALDPAGNVLVAGNTSSHDFPGTIGGAQPTSNGGNDAAFVAQLSSNLVTLIQATYLGGNSGFADANALALDAAGHVFVAGTTDSTDFPGTIGGAQPTNGGGYDAFVARLSSNLKMLAQATYLGGSGFDYAYALALDAGGNVLVAGYTPSTNFPGTAGGAQPAFGGGPGDAFVARLSNNLDVLVHSTYLGGSGYEQANALALDAGGNVLVAGYTNSTNFPGTSGGAQSTKAGGSDAFIANLSPNLVGPNDKIFVDGFEN